MVIGEGIEATASAAQILELPAWSAVACGNLGWRMVLPDSVRFVTIAVDHDDAGIRTARAAAQTWPDENRQFRRPWTPPPKTRTAGNAHPAASRTLAKLQRQHLGNYYPQTSGSKELSPRESSAAVVNALLSTVRNGGAILLLAPDRETRDRLERIFDGWIGDAAGGAA
jgi:hypothetical protein